MGTSNRKQLVQMIILGVLVLAMVLTTVNLMRQLKGPGPRTPQKTAPKVEAKYPSSTNMKAAESTSSKEAQEAVASEVRLNPNQFKVFSLSPPKSPFVQEEQWYADTIKEQVPGYPELKSSRYFDDSKLYLPKLDMILDPSRQWQQVTIDRRIKAPEMELRGTSGDGNVDTTLKLVEQGEDNAKVTWTPESGVPLSELTVPGWEKRYPQLLEGAEAPKPAGIPSDEDLFGGSTEGLSLPGGAGKAEEPQIVCTGVSSKNGKASALLTINGRSFIAKQGGMLGPRLQVLEIKKDGAVLVDSRDGSSIWVPLVEGSGVSLATSAPGSQQPASAAGSSPFDPLTSAFEKGMQSITDSAKQALQDITKSVPTYP